MRKTFLALLVGLTALSAHAIEITATPNATVVWTDDTNKAYPTLTLAINPGGMFATTNALLALGTNTLDLPYSYVVPWDDEPPFACSSIFYRYGDTLDSNISTSVWNDIKPVDENSNVGTFSNNAVSGSNNYMAINWRDGNGDDHYGWLQFDVNLVSLGAPAITFVAGDLNGTAGEAAIAGVVSVPEPSAVLLLLPAAAMLPFLRRFRKGGVGDRETLI